MPKATIIGAGLAGAEAAWQVAEKGIEVVLYEMRPKVMTPAHHTGLFSELVCSNSLKGLSIENAAGLLKKEMRLFNSLIMKAADIAKVPAGGALAVDRDIFSEYITNAIKNHPKITVINEEVKELPKERPLIIATGPLTSPEFSKEISALTGEEYLYFYDAAAPIVTLESLDLNKIYKASRYGRNSEKTEENTALSQDSNSCETEEVSEGDYFNCPLNKEEYEVFYNALISAETVPLKDFEKTIFFEGCMPVEEMARRGVDTIRFGPLKPVGLENPKTGERPYAVVQLRQDNHSGTLYNMVGFQTHLKWPEQKRVFGLIPGLENVEFVRYGVMHRNTFINSPVLLEATLQMINEKGIFFAGQITGVEGYIESAASGLIAGLNAARILSDKPLLILNEKTAHGALCNYITKTDSKRFQPMNINFGIFEPLGEKIKNKKIKNNMLATRALDEINKFIE